MMSEQQKTQFRRSLLNSTSEVMTGIKSFPKARSMSAPIPMERRKRSPYIAWLDATVPVRTLPYLFKDPCGRYIRQIRITRMRVTSPKSASRVRSPQGGDRWGPLFATGREKCTADRWISQLKRNRGPNSHATVRAAGIQHTSTLLPLRYAIGCNLR